MVDDDVDADVEDADDEREEMDERDDVIVAVCRLPSILMPLFSNRNSFIDYYFVCYLLFIH